MRLTSITLTDIGPYTTYTTPITGTMVGITGRNGAGKSTILGAIALAVTGDTGRLGRKNAVRIGRTGTHQPGVILNFDRADGTPVVVGRWLPTDKLRGRHRLVLGETVLSTDDAISNWFATELGVSVSSAAEVMFVAQGGLTDVITASPAKRAETFQKIFGLEAAARGYRAALEHLNGLPAPPDTEDLEAARAHRATVARQAAELTAQLLSVPVYDEAIVDEARTVLSRAVRLRSLETIRARAVQARDEATARLSREPQHGPDSFELAANEAVLRAATAYEQAREACYDKAAQIDTCQYRADHTIVTTDPGEYPPQPSVILEDLRSRRHTIIALTGAKDGDRCPTCAAPFAVDPEARAAAQREWIGLEDLERRFQNDLTVYVRQRNQFLREEAAYDALVGTVESLKRELGRLRVPIDPGTSASVASSRVAQLNDRIHSAARDGDERTRAERNRDRAIEDLKSIEEEMATNVTDEDLRDARELVTVADEAGDQRRIVTAQLNAVDRVLNAATDLESRLANTRAAADRLAGHRTVVQEVVSVLHRDAAPAAAVARAIADLADDVNIRLAQTAADYRISVDQEGEIVATFKDGSPPRPAALLSPGQQTVLAIAWRVAIVDRYSGRAGVICLDEPTTGLDETRISALRSALDAWRAAGTGLQFVVVTHDHRLRGAFDQLIEL